MAIRLIRDMAGRVPAALVVLGCLSLASAILQGGAAEDQTSEPPIEASRAPDADQTIDPLSVNASCYVCHMMFVREEISRVHFAKKVTCIKCHGVSAAHANDENIGATKPDIMFRRDQINAMCVKCHTTHDAPAQAVIARFLERKLKSADVVCTDCHGHHRIEQPEGHDVTDGDGAAVGQADHQ